MYGKDREILNGTANKLLDEIRAKRCEVELRPILLLGYSIGGLLTKQALITII